MSKFYGKKASPSAMGGMYSDAPAGMPKETVQKEYPKASYGSAEAYNDCRDGIDMLAKDNHKKMMAKKGGRY